MEWMILPYKRYFDFSGRSQRKEYWLFTLLWVLVLFAFGALMLAGIPWGQIQAGKPSPVPGPLLWVGGALIGLFVLGSIIPSIAVTVRRFHDQNLSGWFYLLGFIPSVGGIVIIVFMCLDGTTGDNRFGSDPKERGLDNIFS